ncbi:MAG: cytochrome P450, partial [Candidatus Nitrosopolaris sp.]
LLDVHKEFMQLTLAIVCKALLGFDIESQASEIAKYVTTLVEYFNRARLPLAEVIEKLPLSSNRRFRYAKKQLDAIIYRIIDNRQKTHIASGTNLHTHDNHDGDLISILLASKEFSSVNETLPHSISSLQLRDNVMTIGWP